MTFHDGHDRSALKADLALVAFLIAFDVVARILPHAPNFTPIAASALFAGTVLRNRPLALIVPIGAMLVSDAMLGFDRRAIAIFIYAALALPALIAYLPQRLRAPGMFAPAMIGFSILFFVVTNFAVWAFSGMYPLTMAGLAICYVAALPFLQQTMLGDLFWAAVLFGGAALVQGAARFVRQSA